MLFLFAVTFISCDKDNLTDKVEIVKIYVSSETDTYIPWGSETPIECMLVKEEGNTSYSKLPFSGIDGFVYKKGVEYTLKVEKTPEVRMYKCLTADFVVDFEGYFKLTTKEECLKYLTLSFIDFLKNLKYPGKLKKFEKEKLLQAVKDIFIENAIISEQDGV